MEARDNIVPLSSTSYPLKSSAAPIEKSHSLTRKKYQMLQTQDIISQTPKHRLVSTRNVLNNYILNKELLRLEEMLDREEIARYSSPSIEYESIELKEKDLKTYETYLDGIISCIYQHDSRLGFCLRRGWKFYNKTLHKRVRKQDLKEIKHSALATKETATQTFDYEDKNKNQNEMIKYYEVLNHLIKKIETLNNEKLIKSLSVLLKSLRKIDLPPPSLIPEKSCTEYERIIETAKAQNRMHQEKDEFSIEKPKLSKLCLNKNTQTTLSGSDLKVLEYQQILISERDNIISMQTSRMNNLTEVEQLYKAQAGEFQHLKKLLDDYMNSECNHCKEKLDKLKAGTTEIQNLKRSIVKQEKIETELETAKIKLKDVVIVSNKKSEKIQELSDNLEDLNRKIEEIKLQRQQLEVKLRDEEHLRAQAEKELNGEIVSHKILKQTVVRKPYTSNSPIKETFVVKSSTPNSSINYSGIKGAAQGSISSGIEQKDSIIRTEIIRKRHFYDNEDSKIKNTKNIFSSRELSDDASDCGTPVVSKVTVTRKSYSTKRAEKISFKPEKENTIQKILTALSFTREEFLQLPKNARMELYESLYAHREKCGTECEHLKRAMAIKAKHKNQHYPIKKYNIVNN